MADKIKVIHQNKECIGCWACANVAPKYWEVSGEDTKSHLKGCKNEEDAEILELEGDLEVVMEAAEICPVNCIHVEVNDERKI